MKFIFVSHGDLAKSILSSAQMIIGEQEDVVAFGLYPNEDIGGLKEKLEETIEKMKGSDIICFTDLFSGSPFNAVVSLMGDYPIRHFTGMNLPLVLEAFMMRMDGSTTSEALSNKLVNQAPNTFIDVNRYLEEKFEDE